MQSCQRKSHRHCRLEHNKGATQTDLSQLERFVCESEPIEDSSRFEAWYGNDKSLTLFIRSLVGQARKAAIETFGQISRRKALLHHEELDGAFGDSDANAIVNVLAEINRRAAA